MRCLRTRVVIVGAGPSGLLLSHLLSLQGIESIVVERRSREYVEQRVRAGLLEQGTVDLLREAGLADRLDREGLVHEGFELRFDGGRHRLAFTELTGWTTCMYGQQEVVKDLIRAREAAGGAVYFGVDDVALFDLDSDAPRIVCTLHGEPAEISGDFVAGCDGFHGICRRSVPPRSFTAYEHVYPFAWLGILAAVAPSTEELIYAVHERGFALHSMRSPTISRFYLQVGPEEPLVDWPDERIWAELRTRLAVDGWDGLNEGPIVSRGVTAMRSFVMEPMQHGRLFLAGDAAHIVPPSAAKGLNLAVADRYSHDCLATVWQGQEFSAVMTSLLHPFPTDGVYELKLRQARLRDLVTSRATATAFAESYVGLARARLTGALGAPCPRPPGPRTQDRADT